MSINLKSINQASQYILQCLFVLTLATLPLMAGCATKVDGYTATEIFGDTVEAKLANAAAKGDAELVRQLVKRGANPNAIGAQKITPLGWALVAKNATGVEALLAAGADPNTEFGDPVSFHPMTTAPRFEDASILAALLKYGGDPNLIRTTGAYRTPLEAAISDIRKVKMLVEAGADVNGGAEYGYELGKIAVNRKNLDVLSYLIEKGYRTNLSLIAWDIKNDQDHYKPEQNIHKPKILVQLKQLGITPPEKRPMTLVQQKVLQTQKDKAAK